ncbi:hypothetical protein GH714_039089 [Hevea brasiliensis]|uniref:Uncharacterized protein n=1 Tax=Hevea brasiliensis TaxID=3981 RepID=A0A6A6MS45_HEVBR|nr:hypothetical protein GH714_039089 [Hevea brasiliensis]
MKAMPLPFEDFQGKGVLGFSSCFFFFFLFFLLPRFFLSSTTTNQLQQPQKWQNSNTQENCCYVGSEPTSVLDARRSPSPPTSSSTLSSSQGGSNGGGGGASTETTTGVAAAVSGYPSVDVSAEKCGQLGMEDWEGVLPGSPSHEQSILRLIMGDVEDPSLGLNRLLQGGSGSQDMEFNAGFGVVDQGFFFEPIHSTTLVNSIQPSVHGTSSEFPLLSQNARIGSVLSQNPNPVISTSAGNILPGIFNINHHHQLKLQRRSHRFSIHRAHWSQLSLPKVPFPDSRPELFLQRQQHHLQILQQQRPAMMKQKIVTDELAAQQLQQAILNPICQAAELIETGNPVLAQGILARLNHQLSLSIGKPHIRAAFYFKEALQLLLHMNNSTNPSTMSACSLISKIGAYKSFSEISPILQFANFTCNQALLEACEGFDRIHIIDFDIGFGGQWASLMQELAMRNGGVPSLKITAFASPSSHDEVELGFTRENLRIFASEINMPFELEILGHESLNSGSWSLPLCVSEKEVIAVNLPIGPFSNYPLSLPVALRLVKQLSPKVVVSLDRGCDRTDLHSPTM